MGMQKQKGSLQTLGTGAFEENLERETESEPETLNTEHSELAPQGDLGTVPRPDFSEERILSLWLLPSPKQEGARKTSGGREGDDDRITSVAGGVTGAALAGRGGGDGCCSPQRNKPSEAVLSLEQASELPIGCVRTWVIWPSAQTF